MDSIKDLAAWLSQLGKNENRKNAAGALIGTAVSNSKNGTVDVRISGNILRNDNAAEVEAFSLPTTETILAGDSVIVTLLGDGAMKDPIVTSAAGHGGNARIVPLYAGGYTTGTITLTDSVANYNAIEVYWKPPNAIHPVLGCKFLVDAESGDIRMCHSGISSAGSVYMAYQLYTFDRDTLKPSNGQYIQNSKSLTGGTAGTITSGTCIGGIVQVNGILW